MNFRLKSWDVFSWTAMRGGLFRLENDFTAICSGIVHPYYGKDTSF